MICKLAAVVLALGCVLLTLLTVEMPFAPRATVWFTLCLMVLFAVGAVGCGVASRTVWHSAMAIRGLQADQDLAQH